MNNMKFIIKILSYGETNFCEIRSFGHVGTKINLI